MSDDKTSSQCGFTYFVVFALRNPMVFQGTKDGLCYVLRGSLRSVVFSEVCWIRLSALRILLIVLAERSVSTVWFQDGGENLICSEIWFLILLAVRFCRRIVALAMLGIIGSASVILHALFSRRRRRAGALEDSDTSSDSSSAEAMKKVQVSCRNCRFATGLFTFNSSFQECRFRRRGPKQSPLRLVLH